MFEDNYGPLSVAFLANLDKSFGFTLAHHGAAYLTQHHLDRKIDRVFRQIVYSIRTTSSYPDHLGDQLEDLVCRKCESPSENTRAPWFRNRQLTLGLSNLPRQAHPLPTGHSAARHAYQSCRRRAQHLRRRKSRRRPSALLVPGPQGLRHRGHHQQARPDGGTSGHASHRGEDFCASLSVFLRWLRSRLTPRQKPLLKSLHRSPGMDIRDYPSWPFRILSRTIVTCLLAALFCVPVVIQASGLVSRGGAIAAFAVAVTVGCFIVNVIFQDVKANTMLTLALAALLSNCLKSD